MAQLVARFIDIEKVIGSSPIGPTEMEVCSPLRVVARARAAARSDAKGFLYSRSKRSKENAKIKEVKLDLTSFGKFMVNPPYLNPRP